MDENLRLDEEVKGQKNELFNMMYEKYYNPIKNYISKLLLQRHPCDEITQEVFIKFYKNIESLRTQNFKGWLYTVAHNETVNYIRKNSTPVSSLNEQISEPSCDDASHQVLERKLQVKLIKDIFLKMPKSQAVALYLQNIEGYSYHEVASHMGISDKAVKSLIFRGRQNFIKLYEELSGNEL